MDFISLLLLSALFLTGFVVGGYVGYRVGQVSMLDIDAEPPMASASRRRLEGRLVEKEILNAEVIE